MDNVTWWQICLAILGSGGVIGSLVSIFIHLSNKLGEKNKDKKEELNAANVENNKLKRAEADAVTKSLWDIISERNSQIKKLEEKINELDSEIDEIDKTASLSRPTITKIYKAVREMRVTLESINVLLLSEEDTRLFARTFNKLKEKLDEVENSLP